MSDRRGPLPADGSVTVVGASLAGLRAVETLRAEGFAGGITLVGEELHLPYDRPPLSKQVLAGTWPPEKAVLADRHRLGELGTDQRFGQRAVALDAEACRVTLADGSVLESDAVIVATGARPRALPGTDGVPHVHVLRTLDDAEAIRHRILAVGPGCRVVVVGAGFIGSEVASTANDLGCTVHVLEAMATPLAPALGEVIGAACATLHGRHGVDLRTGAAVASIAAAGDEVAVSLADGSSIAADLVVVGIGVVPNTEWLDGSGLEVRNGVVCDAGLFAADAVTCAGDLARWSWRRPGGTEESRIEHWQVAADAGFAAARHLLAGRAAAPPFDPVPYFWSDQYGIRIQMLGHPDPADEVAVVAGALDQEKFAACYGRDGHLTGVVAIGMPRQLMGFRPLLAEGASFDQALAHLS